jgi:hypothetical protein
MKKKSSVRYSAFFNPRALVGFLLCILGAGLAAVALNVVTGRSADAAPNIEIRRNAPQIREGVRPVITRALRDTKPISPAHAPGHNHPEPVIPRFLRSGGVDTARQTSLGPVTSAPTPTGVSWDGVGVGLAGFAPSSNPPDVEGRVGATQYVQWNNTSFAVFDKNSGALLYGPAAGNTLFQSLGGICASHNDGDPVISYDILSGRWVISQFAVGGPAGSASHQCFAVSQTQDATGTWYLYDFVTDTVNFVDYPHTGVWPDGYYMSAHVFNPAGNAFLFARVYVFERDKMIAGQPARMQSANLTGNQFGFLPADLDSLTPPPAGEASFVLGPNPTSNALTSSTRVAVTWGASPTIALTESTISNTTFTTPTCTGNPARRCVPQSGQAAAANLDNIRSHFMYRLAYRNNGTQASPQESLVTNIVVSSTTPSTHNAIRWYEFRNSGNSTTTPTLFQQATFDPDANYRWLGSMAMDKDGDIALGYSKSSSSTFPSIWITGRLAGDTVNTMGAEVQVQAGSGSQDSTGQNRWGDYSSMTLDPVDQCTFYYTNEYLKTTGAFNWSTRVASYRFPSCTNAPAWGTVTGTVTSCATGAPVPGVNVTLSNGFAAATNANGVYSILVPAGSYTASASDPDRNCATGTPSSAPVNPTSGGSVTQDFCVSGASKLDANAVTVDDTTSGGNGNNIVNRNECVNLNIPVKNDGCATETAITANLTTTTPGVTVTQPGSAYPDLIIDASSNNTTPFSISVDSSFVCGTPIALSLNLTYAGGNKSIPLSVPTCAGGANQTFGPTTVTTTDSSQPDRLGRDGSPTTCAGKACPGAINSAGTRNYKTFTFNNASGAPRCFTATITSPLSGGTAPVGDIEAATYQNSYTPPVAQGDALGNLCLNYLGDSGISGLGTTVGNVSYSFTVAANSNFVIVVSTATGATNSNTFSGTVSGFIDNTPGPGTCPAAPAPPVLNSAVSRMTHPGAGPYDVTLPLSGPAGVECRNGAGNYTVVLTFDTPVNGGTATVSSGNVSGVSFSGNDMIIGLSSIADQQTITVTAHNVTNTNGGSLSSASVNAQMLIGDVTADGSVNSADITAAKSDSGQTIGTDTFRADVNDDGDINSADISMVKANSGH